MGFTWLWVIAAAKYKITLGDNLQALSSHINQPARSHSILLCSHPAPALPVYLWLQGSTNSSRKHPNLSLHNLLLFQSWGFHTFFQSLLIMPWSIFLFPDLSLLSTKSLISSDTFCQRPQSRTSTWWWFFLPRPHHVWHASFQGGIIMCSCSE